MMVINNIEGCVFIMEKTKILPIKSDIVFRLFFADERNVEELISFLKSILELPDDEYSVRNCP